MPPGHAPSLTAKPAGPTQHDKGACINWIGQLLVLWLGEAASSDYGGGGEFKTLQAPAFGVMQASSTTSAKALPKSHRSRKVLIEVCIEHHAVQAAILLLYPIADILRPCSRSGCWCT